jgi:hypothetical protein
MRCEVLKTDGIHSSRSVSELLPLIVSRSLLQKPSRLACDLVYLTSTLSESSLPLPFLSTWHQDVASATVGEGEETV